MSSSVALPVQALREHITALEAAITVCLADPGHKPVHKLRTETRRVEALLLLLALVPGLPEHRKEAAALLRALAKLRRAAGTVRDLDVHRKMLEEFAETEDGLAHGGIPSIGTPPAKAKSAEKAPPAAAKSRAKSTADQAQSAAAHLRDAATDLRKQMARERDKAAAALQDLLKERQTKTARAAEKLLAVLEPAQDLALPAPDLLRDAESVLTRAGLLHPNTLPKLEEDDLHSVRKAAKAARYVAEALPDDHALSEAARGFEALQEAGGQWHDALELARAARRYFGKSHDLTVAYKQQRDTKLKAYRAALSARAALNARIGSSARAGTTPRSPNKPSARRTRQGSRALHAM